MSIQNCMSFKLLCVSSCNFCSSSLSLLLVCCFGIVIVVVVAVLVVCVLICVWIWVKLKSVTSFEFCAQICDSRISALLCKFFFKMQACKRPKLGLLDLRSVYSKAVATNCNCKFVSCFEMCRIKALLRNARFAVCGECFCHLLSSCEFEN